MWQRFFSEYCIRKYQKPRAWMSLGAYFHIFPKKPRTAEQLRRLLRKDMQRFGTSRPYCSWPCLGRALGIPGSGFGVGHHQLNQLIATKWINIISINGISMAHLKSDIESMESQLELPISWYFMVSPSVQPASCSSDSSPISRCDQLRSEEFHQLPPWASCKGRPKLLFFKMETSSSLRIERLDMTGSWNGMCRLDLSKLVEICRNLIFDIIR